MRAIGPRLLTSAVLIAIVVGTLFLCPPWVYAVVITGFIAVGLYEFFTMARHRGVVVPRPLTIGLGVVFTGLVIWRSMIEPGLVPAPLPVPGTLVISWLWDVFWPATILIIFVRQLLRENTFEALSGLATTLFGLAYVAALFSYMLYLRAVDSHQGAWLVCYLILVTKMGDAGAYAIGNVLGRHTLVPRISPRKTVEGFAGGVLLSSLTAVLAQPLLGGHSVFGHAPTVFFSILLGIILGVVGQIGDLAESLLKRDCQVKDTGVLLPGLGGVLDVLDSLLFTAPLFYGIVIYG